MKWLLGIVVTILLAGSVLAASAFCTQAEININLQKAQGVTAERHKRGQQDYANILTAIQKVSDKVDGLQRELQHRNNEK